MAAAAHPTVLLRLSCADEEEYRRTFAARFASAGVFIPTSRMRPVGSLISLRIELLDGSTAATRGARVESLQDGEGRRPGYFVRFVEVSDRASPAGSTAGGKPPAEGARERGPAHAPGRGESTSLEEYLFSDTPVPSPHAPDEPPARGRPRAGPAFFVADDPAPGEVDWSELAEPGPAEPEPAATPARGAQPEPAPGPPRHHGLLGWLIGTAVLGLVLSVTALLVSQARAGAARAEASFAASIRAVDVCLGSGRLAGSGPDTAVQHLAAARRLAPEDPRLRSRAALVAEKLEELGRRALARSDWAEAAVHFEAALAAEPGRRAALEALQQIAAGHPAAGSRP